MCTVLHAQREGAWELVYTWQTAQRRLQHARPRPSAARAGQNGGPVSTRSNSTSRRRPTDTLRALDALPAAPR